MKTRSIIISAALSAALLCSCHKDNTPRYAYQANFYVGGNVAQDAAYIYKDTEQLYRLAPDNSNVNGLGLAKDGLIACGYILNTASLTASPAIWKDGEILDTDFGSAIGALSDLVVFGDTWACCGNFRGENGDYGVLIENGQIVYTSECGVRFCCMDCSATGDYYIVTTNEDSVNLWRISAGTKRLMATEVVAINEETFFWTPNCIYVGSYDVAIGLAKDNYENGTADAWCWIDGMLQHIGQDCVVNDLTFFNGYCVTGGYRLGKASEAGAPRPTTATQWVGGMAEDYSYGCSGNSSLRLLMNWGGTLLFQCVQSDSGIQICNGNLVEEIKTPAGFNASCWDATIKAVPVN